MSDETEITIPLRNLVKWLCLGLPAVALWAIGGQGALALIGGLSTGAVTPGTGSSASTLFGMWGLIVVCALGGIGLGMTSLFRSVRKRYLVINFLLGGFSLFFSVLAD